MATSGGRVTIERHPAVGDGDAAADLALEVFGSSTRKSSGGRPVAAETIRLRSAILDLQEEHDVMTVRQIFYALVSRGVIPKDENRGYRPVQRNVLELRRPGDLPWSFIADSTRWQRKPETWDSAVDALNATARTYRRNLWRDQGVRFEIWLEKDALAGVLVPVTDKWDVSLMISRGVSSATFLHAAVEAANDAYETAEIETIVVTLFDYDAGGARARRTITRYFDEYATAPITFEHVAVTENQITEWSLPTRPAKKSDPEAHKHAEIAVELDAIPPNKLKSLVESEITTRIDAHAWNLARQYEAEERGFLKLVAAGGLAA